MKYRWWALAVLLGWTASVSADDPRESDRPLNQRQPDKQIEVRKGERAEAIHIPYRRTLTQHILVRAKINGKGPFNFILDSGAPIFFVNTAVGKKLGLETNENGDAVLDLFEIEGGVKMKKVKARIETPFQLEGMNGMGLAGAELHGIIGYTIMAQFRMEVDFTKTKMAWTPLDFEPPRPWGIGGKGASSAGGLEMMGTVMKFLGFLTGVKVNPETAPRGFVGIALAEKDKLVTINSVLAKSPADTAGLKVGDQIAEINGKVVSSLEDVHRLTAQITVGQSLQLIICRDKEERKISLATGEGL